MEIKNGRNGREFKLPELLHFSVDGNCPEPNRVYEIFGCCWHGKHCQTFRDVITANGDSLTARYEQTISRLEQITRAGYQAKFQWECEFDDAAIETLELLEHPAVCQSPLCSRGTL